MEAEMTAARRAAAILPSLLFILVPASAVHAQAPPEAPAQVAPQSPAAPPVGSKLWIVGGGGFSMARAGCADCDRAGVFTNSKGLFLDVGGRVSERVDAGVEVMFVTARLDEDPLSDPIRTTFIMAIAQFRPRLESGFYLRAGMGVGFAGNGLINPSGPALEPPYSTNALGVTYGLGWIFRRERRWTIQANFAHHIAAIGELQTVNGETIRNVVANYWMSGVAIVFR
jgi:hypothetical protein